MRIAIVTVYDSIVNYGSFLQAYALGAVLKDMGHSVFYVRRMPEKNILERFNRIVKEQNTVKGSSVVKRTVSRLSSQRVIRREKNANLRRLECFKKDWKEISLVDADKLIENNIDLVICGSDEIWNLHNKDVDLSFYDCGWVEDIPKLAYAISSGNTEITEFSGNPDFFNAVGSFNRIMPRDCLTKKLMEQITGIQENIVCDPTILLEKNHYSITQKGKEFGRYILVYSYYLTSIEKEYIRRYAHENQLKIVSPCIYLSIADEVVYTSSMDFPSLIANAECVYTTTFHGTIFSLMFAKRMCIMPRLPKVENLLEQVHSKELSFLKNGTYDMFSMVLNIIPDRDKIENAMNEMRESSITMLKTAIDSIANQGCRPVGNCYRDLKRYFYGYSPEAREKSSSGGMFFEFASIILRRGGVVFGAAYNVDTKRVEHCSTEEVSLEALLRSKYADSFMGNTFVKIEKYLSEGREVLFCGTPCQSAGLNQLCRTRFDRFKDKLFSIDFLCEGVPSKRVFEQYLRSIEEHKKKKVKDVNFRSKYYGWNVHCMKLTFEDDSVLVRPSFADSYMHTFIMDLVINRPSCYQCAFRENKYSDITIGDFWKVKNVDSSCTDNRGVSAIIVNTSLGEALLESVSNNIVLHELKNEHISEMIRKLDTDSVKTKRDKFYKIFANQGYNKAIQRYSSYMGNTSFIKRLKMLKRWMKLESKIKKSDL